MNKKLFCAVTTGYVFLVLTAFYLDAGKKPELPQPYEKWLKEEVVYIISPKEKEAFTKLETNRERDLFMEEFWKQRDPTPGSVRNEFKERHYRRIEEANKMFGRGTPLPGWRTDRGRIYIALGEPKQRVRYGGKLGATYPCELWYYQGNPGLGQPTFFRLLFFKRFGVGPYEIYSPISDGPRSLTHLVSLYGTMGTDDPNAADKLAFELLKNVEGPELAYASWSSFPTSDGRLMLEFNGDRMASSILVEQVRTYPYKHIKDDYVYDFLEHKATVEVDYSAHYMNSRSLIEVLQDEAGLSYVHFSVEPEKLSVDFFEDKYFTNLKKTVRVEGAEGKTVFQHEEILPLELKEEQLETIGSRPFHLYDMFPLVPGSYTLHIHLENTVTREFTSIEKNLTVNGPRIPGLGPVILADRVEMVEGKDKGTHPFKAGNIQLYPSIRNRFSQEDPLFVFFQISSLDPSLKEQGKVSFTVVKDERIVLTYEKPLSGCKTLPHFLEDISLKGMAPGEYELKVSLRTGQVDEVFSAEKTFTVVGKSLPETWVFFQEGPPLADPVYFFIRGNQYLNKGEPEKARPLLAQAYRSEPEALDFALCYARSLLFLNEHTEARCVLVPFLEWDWDQFELYYYLGLAYQGEKNFEKAVEHYQEALTRKGNVVPILNAVGDCLLTLGDGNEALKAWKKSLEVNPDQEEIKAKIRKVEIKK
ncbi:MAG: GWxTD domain-containing protein [Candidatus Aminicenantes bacterium]|nr:GWxTD domain-containing protein [Candidatus Aminicenantes bacterium]